jgi:hypothetical protein
MKLLFPKQVYSVSQFLHSYICETFIYFQDRSAYSAEGKYVYRSWEYINHSHMSVEIGTEAAQFPEKEYINEIFLAVRPGIVPAYAPYKPLLYEPDQSKFSSRHLS